MWGLRADVYAAMALSMQTIWNYSASEALNKVVTPAIAGVQRLDLTGFRLSPE